MFKKKIKEENKFHVLPDKEYIFSFLHHGVFHKNFSEMAIIAGIKNLSEKINTYVKFLEDSIHHLIKYIEEKDYHKKLKYSEKLLNIVKWRRILKKYDFYDIHSILTEREAASGYSCYFTANYNGIFCFVKCGTGKSAVVKEYKSLLKLNELYHEYFPKPIFYKIQEDNEMMIAVEFIEGCALSENLISQSSQEKKEKMFNAIYNIAEILYKNKLIHRDFNCDNLIVLPDGGVKLIDFQHVIGCGLPEDEINIINPKLLRGTNKHLRPAPYTWDDMHSAYIILKMFNDCNIPEYSEKINKIKNKIGKLRYYFLWNKFFLISYLHYEFFIFYKIYGFVQKPLCQLAKHLNKSK